MVLYYSEYTCTQRERPLPAWKGGPALSVWNAIVLGIVQGIAEFLPISSSGHLSILQNLFHLQSAENGHMFFDVLLHLATLVSVCIAYRREVADIVMEIVSWFKRDLPQSRRPSDPLATRRLIFMIVIGTLPLFVIVFFNDLIEPLYYSTIFIGIALILTGCMLYVSDRMVPGRKTEKSMRVRDALIIGVCQAVAVIPGLSRSGTTITAGLSVGMNRERAVRFSFLLSIPAILGANLIALIKAFKKGIDASLLPAYLLGMVVAGVVGYFSIELLRRIARKGRFGGFAYYCWAVGLLAILLTVIL